jgi:VIT1/CCC1 family predicted Fe2+/Mn2+ transporter
MKNSIKLGLCFGLTSGIITTLGLMVGLHSGTHSALAVVGGVLTIAIADAFSDAMGMHISQESEKNRTTKYIWESTLSTFFAKFFFALTFIIPVLIFYNSLGIAIIISVVWGLSLIGVLSIIIATKKKEKIWKVTTEHVGIALVVIVIAHLAGDLISITFH